MNAAKEVCPAVTARLAHRRKDNMNTQQRRIDRPPDKRETAAPSRIGNGGEESAQTNTANHGQALNQAACRAISDALTGDADAHDLALVLRNRLTEPQVLTVMAGCAWALTPHKAGQMAEAIAADATASRTIRPDRVAPTVAEEAERQRRQWAKWCATSLRRRPEPFKESTPRERLAKAWDEASDKDRSDLIARVTMGAAA